MGRVFINLLDNAFYAVAEESGDNSPESGVVRVSSRRNNGFVEICVGDNGVGIPEGIQEKIFEPLLYNETDWKRNGTRIVPESRHRC